MHCTTEITEDLYYVGGTDRRLSLFENVYPLNNGVSYNSYLLLDEKTVLFDTADRAVADRFIENVRYILNGRTLDYIVIDHMEPDHSASLAKMIALYPEAEIIATAKALELIKQFFDFDEPLHTKAVKDGDALSSGKHLLKFFTAPMVHWPEVMVTYDETAKALFSADAFGTFGAPSGNIFADGVNFERDYLDEARRYYANIVGKYGPQVTALLKKAAGLDIQLLLPLHGFVWRENIGWFIDKYSRWAAYEPEEKGVVIVCGSVYGGTENAAELLAFELAKLNVKNVKLYDASSTHASYILSEFFRASNIVFACSTYNNGIFTPMEDLLADVKAHNIKKIKFSVIENGSWAPVSGSKIIELVQSLPEAELVGEKVTIRSTVKDEDLARIKELANAIAKSVN